MALLVVCGGGLVLTSVYQAWLTNVPNGAPDIDSVATEIMVVFWVGVALIAAAFAYLVLSIRHDNAALRAARRRSSQKSHF
ncbi:MAG TPA: hypothetical protein EYH07_11335 [Kiloniellaceae bacterium]|nr:hypothetical protein [Kiloniellaceae bacterium]